MAHQSLYRRYRPRRFGELRGQDHVVRALRNAVAGDSVGHAYLFSGPRGTGKTSTARILAKALNCEDLRDGEPCCECDSCLAVEAGRSFDLFELDAASNNGVEQVRELIRRSVEGSPGRTKVYILDEVHMLTPAASNALLKTLEEPPGHVCFVLATTDPQKVLPTIRSRTQHYEFQLLSAAELEAYVRWVAEDAGLDVDDAGVAHVVRAGRGSARDTLSALDQVVAAGGVVERAQPVEALLAALAGSSTGDAIAAVADALAQGSEPRTLGEAFVATLRDVFLVSLGVAVPHLVEDDRGRLGDWAHQLGTARVTAAMEAVGSALVDMRQAADPRVPLEVALVRLTASGDDSVEALARRVERLEAALAAGPAGLAAAPSRSADTSAAPARPGRGGPAPAAAPAASGAPEAAAPGTQDAAPARPAAAAPAPAARPAAPAPASPSRATPAPGPPPRRPRRGAAPQPDATRDGGSAPAPGPGPAAPADAAPARGDRAVGSGSSRPAPEAAAAAGPAPAPTTPAAGAASGAPAGSAPAGAPDREALTVAFGDVVIPQLKGVAKAIYSTGRFVAVTDRGAVFALDNAPARDRAERYRESVEGALTAHFGQPVHLVLIEESEAGAHQGSPSPPAGTGGSPATSSPSSGSEPDAAPAGDGPVPPDPGDDEDHIDVAELEDATDVAVSGVEKLTEAFPGSVLVDDDEVPR